MVDAGVDASPTVKSSSSVPIAPVLLALEYSQIPTCPAAVMRWAEASVVVICQDGTAVPGFQARA